MSEHFVNLNCANCGAKLDVYDDMERFACGFCGTEMIVQRRGGTVTIKAVTEAIQKVQIGTDKTAAELALARLSRNLVQLNEEVVALRTRAELLKTETSNKRGCATFYGGGCGLIGVLLVIGSLQVSFQGGETNPLLYIGAVMAIGSFLWLRAAWEKSSIDQGLQGQIAAKQKEIQILKDRIAEQQRIVDGVN